MESGNPIDNMKNWFLPKITDYWDWTQESIKNFSLEIMAVSPKDRMQQYSAIREAVKEHVRVLPDRTLLDVMYVAADDIFKEGNRTTMGGSAFQMYLEASAGTLYSLARERGCYLHYLVDNMYEQTPDGMRRPLELYGGWFSATGLVYICPQHLALSLMQADQHDPGQYFALLPKYIEEAIAVAEQAADQCHAEFMHYAFLNADCSPDPFPFKSSMSVAGFPGVVTALRTEAPVAGSSISVYYPQTGG